MLAAQRARDFSAGAALTIDRDNDKNPVVALREIAEDKLDLDAIRAVDREEPAASISEPEEPEDEGGFGTGETDMLADLMKNEAAAGGRDSRGREEFEDDPAATAEEVRRGRNGGRLQRLSVKIPRQRQDRSERHGEARLAQ